MGTRKTSVVCSTAVSHRYTVLWHAPAILIIAIRVNEELQARVLAKTVLIMKNVVNVIKILSGFDNRLCISTFSSKSLCRTNTVNTVFEEKHNHVEREKNPSMTRPCPTAL